MHRLAPFLATAPLLLAGCGTTASTTTAIVEADARVSGEADAGTGSDTTADAAALPDAEEPAPAEPRPAPDLATPARSAEVDALYCGLNNGQLVQAALRGSACLGISAAAFLDENARGLFFGDALLGSYAAAGYGGCEFVRCLNDATNCDEAARCQQARDLGPCDATVEQRRCDGSRLEACLWNGSAYRWYRTTDCEHIGAACVERFCPNGACLPTATCVREPMTEFCETYGRCEGDRLVRCMPRDGASSYAAEVAIDCGELVGGGTCVMTPVGGEIPAPACAAAEPDCVNAFGGSSCVSDTEIALCLFGRKTTLDCGAFGYARCQPGESGFETRCVP